MLEQHSTNRNVVDIEQMLAGIDQLSTEEQIERLQLVVAELEKLLS